MATKNLSLGVTKVVITVGLIFIILMSSSILVSAASRKTTTGKTSTSVNVYSDSACIKKISSIDWGQIFVGASVNKTIYVKNTGTTTLTLSLVQSNWYPASTNNLITCVWNRENTKLAPNQIVSATLLLTTTANFSVSTSFSVDIIITGRN